MIVRENVPGFEGLPFPRSAITGQISLSTADENGSFMAGENGTLRLWVTSPIYAVLPSFTFLRERGEDSSEPWWRARQSSVC